MPTINDLNGAKMSKYAAKKAAEKSKEVVDVESTVERKITTENPAKGFKKPYAKEKNADGLPVVVDNFPKHVVAIALLIKNNAEIRRFTALGILNYLLQKGEINGEHRYVSFKWNKFAVKANGLMREFSYNEPFFLNALVAAFSSFSASAQRVIDDFCKKEMSINITKAVDQEEVENITKLNEQYQNEKVITD